MFIFMGRPKSPYGRTSTTFRVDDETRKSIIKIISMSHRWKQPLSTYSDVVIFAIRFIMYNKNEVDRLHLRDKN
jgi:DNA-binding MurR/RpiR family transcriptional regulator